MSKEEKIIILYKPLIIKICRMYINVPIPQDDLIQEGSLACLIAYRRFDASKNIKFIDYAYKFIKGSILDYISKYSRIINLPKEVVFKINSYLKAKNKLLMTYHNLDMAKIANYLGLPLETVELYELFKDDCQFLNYIYDNSSTIKELNDNDYYAVAADNQLASKTNLEDEVMNNCLQENLQSILASVKLSENEKLTIRKRLGMDDGKIYSYDAIGKLTHKTRQGAYLTFNRALKKIRQNADINKLKDYC